MMAYTLRIQRQATLVVAAVAILWGAWAEAPILGLWAAVWIIGVACVAVGALVNELEQRKRRSSRTSAGRVQARTVMVSGFGYLTAGMLAGWFHPTLGAAILALALADFVAGHHVARALTSASRSRPS